MRPAPPFRDLYLLSYLELREDRKPTDNFGSDGYYPMVGDTVRARYLTPEELDVVVTDMRNNVQHMFPGRKLKVRVRKVTVLSEDHYVV